MSMLDVAKYLSYSRSIDLSSEKDRYFNLSMANSGQLFSRLHSRNRLSLSPACTRQSAEEQGRIKDKEE